MSAPTRAPTPPSTTAVNAPIVGVPQVPEAKHLRVLVAPQSSCWRERKRPWTWKKSLSSNSVSLCTSCVPALRHFMCLFPSSRTLVRDSILQAALFTESIACSPAVFGCLWRLTTLKSVGGPFTAASAQWLAGCLQFPQGLQPETPESPMVCPAPHPLHPTYQTSPEWFLPSRICLMSLESIHFSPVLAPGSTTLSPVLAFEVHLSLSCSSKWTQIKTTLLRG